MVCGGSTVHGVQSAREGAALAARLARAAAPSFTPLYLDDVDSAGTSSVPATRARSAWRSTLLDAIEQRARRARSPARRARSCCCSRTTARWPTDPERCIYVNERCPALVPLLRSGADGRPLAPAGSARDLFLHVREGALDEAVGLLAALFGEDAWVAPTAQLAEDGVFGPRVSERFRERVGDLVVLPRAGVEAWWREPGRFEQKLHGHHGGLEPAEAETWLGALVP